MLVTVPTKSLNINKDRNSMTRLGEILPFRLLFTQPIFTKKDVSTPGLFEVSKVVLWGCFGLSNQALVKIFCIFGHFFDGNLFDFLVTLDTNSL